MSTLLRVGFIGCGGHATNAIWPSLRYSPIEVAWACDLDETLARRNTRRFGAERATTDIADVLGDPSVQAVFVVGPPAMHHSVGLQVLGSGKHLFIEKPPGETLEHAIELRDAAHANGRQMMVGFMKRFAIGYQMAASLASDPDFGGVRLLKVNYSHWRQTDLRRHLIFMSTHPIDLMRFFMGAEPTAGVVSKHTFADGASTLTATFEFDGGRSAMLNLSANDPHVQEWVDLSGASRLVTVRNLTEVRSYAEAGTFAPTIGNPQKATLWHPDFTIPWKEADSLWLQGYAGEVEAFANALLENRPVSPSIDDGVAAMRIVESLMAAPEGASTL